MDLIKIEYIREYQRGYQIEYYKNNREDIAEKNRIYYEIHKEIKVLKEKKEKIIKEKVVIINFDLIKVEKKFIRLFFD